MIFSRVSDFGLLLLKLTMHLSYASYRDYSSEFGNEMLLKNTTDKFEKHIFYIYKLEGSSWIINRGSESLIDYLACDESKLNQNTVWNISSQCL
jgi:hypothetical protein